MKIIKQLQYLTMGFCLLLSGRSFAQDKKGYDLGPAKTFISKLKGSTVAGITDQKPSLKLLLPDGKLITGKHNYTGKQDAETVVIGSIENSLNSSFIFHYTDTEVRGQVLLVDKKLAFEYYTENGNSMVKEVDINKILCVDYTKSTKEKNLSGQFSAQLVPAPGDPVYNLQSYPGGTGVVMLDFDGETVSGTTWDGGNTINAAPGNFTAAQIQEIWEMVSEDFRPFTLNITTSDAVFASYPRSSRIKCVFTPTNYFNLNAGGVAHLGSFRENTDSNKPCWVFETGRAAGIAASHEIGHTLGLSHDGRTSPSEEYYYGQGNWAPTMGVGYYKPIVQWSKGEYANPSNTEDDVSIIASPSVSGNGIFIRPDDDANTVAGAKVLAMDAQGNILPAQNMGIITTTTDLDYFKFSITKGSVCTLTVAPNVVKQNATIRVKLYGVSGLIASNLTTMITDLPAGGYYITVDGSGDGNPLTTGYSDYGSLGTYSISGSIVPLCATVNVPLIGGPKYLCTNPPTLPYTIAGGSTRAATYTWSLSSGMGNFSPSNTGTTVNVDFDNFISPGNYTISVVASNGCGQSASGSYVVGISNSTTPPAPPTPTGPSAVCNSGTISTYSVGNLTASITYEITPTSAVASTGKNPNEDLVVDWSNTFVGTASIRAKATSGCGLISGWSGYKNVSIANGVCRMAYVDKTALEEGLSAAIYPNPSEDRATLIINNNYAENASIEIVDSKGIVVYRNEMVPTNTEFNIGENLTSGIYIVKISYGENKKFLKFVKL
jgi:hypothetical protein